MNVSRRAQLRKTLRDVISFSILITWMDYITRFFIIHHLYQVASLLYFLSIVFRSLLKYGLLGGVWAHLLL
jgi:hypothetical protein